MNLAEPGSLETDVVVVRSLKHSDLAGVVSIDARATWHNRPEYFELMMKRAVQEAGLQVLVSM